MLARDAVRGTADDTLDAMRDSALLYRLADEVARIDDAIDLRRDHRDSLKAQIRGLLEKRGRKSAVMGDLEVRLSPAREVICGCHGVEAPTCPVAVTGHPIQTTLRECTPYVVVRRKR